ncbi:hypothetical protein FQN55_003606 [Onygenales sp. PD_40]|nr:hypothetical protein FQN55_003606 [Onygenales sp. PD_40]
MDTSDQIQHSALEKDRPSKRRKVALACDRCRGRKVRCDGIHPACGPCAKRSDSGVGVQCTYTVDVERSSKLVGRDYVANLENRIRYLERDRALHSPVSERHGSIGGDNGIIYRPGRRSTTSVFSPKSLPTSPESRQVTQHLPSQANAIPTPLSYQDAQHDGLSGKSNRPALNQGIHRGPFDHRIHHNRGPSTAHESQPDLTGTDDADDGVNAMMGAVGGNRQTQAFFGSSSAAGFIRQVRKAIDVKMGHPPEEHSGSPALENGRFSTMRPIRKSNSQSQYDGANYVLPPRKTADALLDTYWKLVHPLYPFLDHELGSAYESIWTGETTDYDENMLMCIFNVMFALGCQLSEAIKPEQREASAAVYFNRAKELLHFNLWENDSVGLIQCLLIMGQYLQSTNSAHQCWIVIGLAIRIAQSLGLHLPQTATQFRDPRDHQLARKIWHGCVLMDRVVSMTFGRPAMITKGAASLVPLPMPLDEELITPEPGVDGLQLEGRTWMIAFFSASLGLYEIMNDILLTLYTPVFEEPRNDIHMFYFSQDGKEGGVSIFELDRALTKWSRSLPPHLRDISARPDRNPIFQRQAIVLRARFLHVRMLLFRPTLSRFCTARDNTTPSDDPFVSLDDTLPQRIALQCSIICVKVAQEVIELIYKSIPTDGTVGPLPAWWYNILYVYTAATVLIAGCLRSAIVTEVTEPAITRSWNCALEILRKYHDYSTSARRCVAALEILYDRVASEAVSSSKAHRADQAQGSVAPPAPDLGNDSSRLNDGSSGGGFDNFAFLDLQDMSWLNSVPSNL